MKRKRILAFTLAEVLITLGIIGVVAAMTIPTLMQKTNRSEIVAGAKKSYANFANALKLAEAQHGNDIRKWSGVVSDEYSVDEYGQYGLTANDWIGYMYLLNNLKIIKSCANSLGCYVGEKNNPNDNVLRLNGVKDMSYPLSGTYKYRLADGTSMAIRNISIGGTPPRFLDSTSGVKVFIDVNGDKAPNQIGYDQFYFQTDSFGKLQPNRLSSSAGDCNINGDGYSCMEYILENNNMDYLDN